MTSGKRRCIVCACQDHDGPGTRLAAGVSPRALRSLPSQDVPRKMPADPVVVISEGIVAETPQGLTVILGRARAGDEQARGELFALIYDELRRVASRLMRRERPGQPGGWDE